MRTTCRALWILMVGAGFLATTVTAGAHCDQMDGPVVRAGQQALAGGEIQPVLKWVHEAQEAELRSAFERALGVRKLGGEAQELADRWFLETLVRLHRASEGAPFTGLKPADTPVSPGIEKADQALEEDSAQVVIDFITAQVEQGLRERFEQARKLRATTPGDVEAGRAAVDAYVEYIHYAKRLYEDATTDAHREKPGEKEAVEAGATPTGQLEKEHQVTLVVVDEAEKEAARLRQGELNVDRVGKMLDFFVNFTDRCHHAKEERYYFPATNRELAIEALITELKEEHDRGKVLLGQARQALEAKDKKALADALAGYAALIREHISKENQQLFGRGAEQLSEEERKHVMQGFRKIEQEELGEGFHEKYHAMALGLAAGGPGVANE